MAYSWTDKTVYIRETTDGKTRWVKLEGVKARRSSRGVVVIKLTDFEQQDAGYTVRGSLHDEKRFISRRE